MDLSKIYTEEMPTTYLTKSGNFWNKKSFQPKGREKIAGNGEIEVGKDKKTDDIIIRHLKERSKYAVIKSQSLFDIAKDLPLSFCETETKEDGSTVSYHFLHWHIADNYDKTSVGIRFGKADIVFHNIAWETNSFKLLDLTKVIEEVIKRHFPNCA